MEATLAKLRKLCIELGADDAEIAASVHPTLRTYHQTMRGHYFSYTAAKAAAEEAAGEKVEKARRSYFFSNMFQQV
jgi:hypothetical protein